MDDDRPVGDDLSGSDDRPLRNDDRAWGVEVCVCVGEEVDNRAGVNDRSGER